MGYRICPSSWGNYFWGALGVLLEGNGSHSRNDTWQSGAGLGVQDRASGGPHAFGVLAVSLGAAFGLGVEISDYDSWGYADSDTFLLPGKPPNRD